MNRARGEIADFVTKLLGHKNDIRNPLTSNNKFVVWDFLEIAIRELEIAQSGHFYVHKLF